MRNLTFASLEPPLEPDEPLAAYLERLYHEALDERNKYIQVELCELAQLRLAGGSHGSRSRGA